MPVDASQIKLNYVVELKSVEFVIKNALSGLRLLVFKYKCFIAEILGLQLKYALDFVGGISGNILYRRLFQKYCGTFNLILPQIYYQMNYLN